MPRSQRFFHVHLVSDATGETLIAVSRAAAAQYADIRAVEHVYPLVRKQEHLDEALTEIEVSPGIILYTLVNRELADKLEERCHSLGLPAVSILRPVLRVFRSYLGAETTPRIGGQHLLDRDYFRRIDALNFTMLHDDGQHPEHLETADVILVGISRSSKTPTSIYLANRGMRTANVPIILNVPLPPELERAKRPLVVGLVASADRIMQIRRNRVLSMRAEERTDYTDRSIILQELAYMRRLCAKHEWPILDISRRSIEETAATIIAMHQRMGAEQAQ